MRGIGLLIALCAVPIAGCTAASAQSAPAPAECRRARDCVVYVCEHDCCPIPAAIPRSRLAAERATCEQRPPCERGGCLGDAPSFGVACIEGRCSMLPHPRPGPPRHR